jgi:hypothetical protein
VAKQSTDQAAIAAFLAKKPITKVPEGVRTLSESEIWHHRHDVEKLSRERLDAENEQRLIDQRRVVIANGREFVTNGLGERIA